MAKLSAGLLFYRRTAAGIEVFLVHPGGPFWQSKDLGAWSIPKGEFTAGEDPLEAAKREFHEETGFHAKGEFRALQPRKQRSGKVVFAWAAEGNFDPSQLVSNTFALEWPRGSGKTREFPEIDRAGWFSMEDAKQKILPGQRALLHELQRFVLGGSAAT
jgi:predicted NUDIX family NTP pyrophosphohydrolase